ncbi:hypothetical protein L4D08_23645 [Photobacterium chitinilyticum]|uniref:hypothetical protein n=1 Tax=Photobacterium chitinilyticum TaxID=2485123 RepID=UPI003D0C15E6
MNTKDSVIQELIDRLNEMTQCMDCVVPILDEHGYSITDAQTQIEISNTTIEAAKAKQKEWV